jgi:hypothetical protein
VDTATQPGTLTHVGHFLEWISPRDPLCALHSGLPLSLPTILGKAHAQAHPTPNRFLSALGPPVLSPLPVGSQLA